MRLGMIAALIFIVLATGVLYSSVTNQSVIAASVEQSTETMISATKVVQEGDFGPDNFLTLLAAPFAYFDSLVDIAWSAFNNPLFTAETGWAIVPYFTITPFEMVLFLGLILLLIGIAQKQL